MELGNIIIFICFSQRPQQWNKYKYQIIMRKVWLYQTKDPSQGSILSSALAHLSVLGSPQAGLKGVLPSHHYSSAIGIQRHIAIAYRATPPWSYPRITISRQFPLIKKGEKKSIQKPCHLNPILLEFLLQRTSVTRDLAQNPLFRISFQVQHVCLLCRMGNQLGCNPLHIYVRVNPVVDQDLLLSKYAQYCTSLWFTIAAPVWIVQYALFCILHV